MAVRNILVLLAVTLLTACGKPPDARIAVSVLGGPISMVDPDREPLSNAQSVLIGSVAQGLVAFDASGQIEPALAERWIVTDDGLSYIFRLRKAKFANGKVIDADMIVARLRAAIRANSRNALRPALEAIEEMTAITPEVIEIRLRTPRPPLLHLLAQPELAIAVRGGGTGPFRMSALRRGVTQLDPMPAPDADPDEPVAVGDPVVLRLDRPSVAIMRFIGGGSDLVLGGDFAQLPLIRATNNRARELRFDPAEGLFGLAIVGNSAFLSDADNRRALAMSLDRQAMIDKIGGPASVPVLAVLPERYRSAADPATPGWSLLTQDQRVATAKATIDAWRSGSRSPPVLRIALPDGPGSKLLVAQIAADWAKIGVSVERVQSMADADIRLVDRVAPAPSAIWYLRTAGCPEADRCDKATGEALDRAVAATDLATRGQALAEADQALSGSARFIVLTRPIRWSLVARRLGQYRDNPRAWHPVNHLLGPAN